MRIGRYPKIMTLCTNFVGFVSDSVDNFVLLMLRLCTVVYQKML